MTSKYKKRLKVLSYYNDFQNLFHNYYGLYYNFMFLIILSTKRDTSIFLYDLPIYLSVCPLISFVIKRVRKIKRYRLQLLVIDTSFHPISDVRSNWLCRLVVGCDVVPIRREKQSLPLYKSIRFYLEIPVFWRLPSRSLSRRRGIQTLHEKSTLLKRIHIQGIIHTYTYIWAHVYTHIN